MKAVDPIDCMGFSLIYVSRMVGKSIKHGPKSGTERAVEFGKGFHFPGVTFSQGIVIPNYQFVVNFLYSCMDY